MHDREPVVIIIDEQQPVLVAPRRKFDRRKHLLHWPSRMIGVALTGLVHMLFVSPFILGVAAHKTRPSPDGIGTTAWASQGEQYESMMLIDLSALESDSGLDLAMHKPNESQAAGDVPLMLVSYEPSPPPELEIEEDAEEADEASKAAGDPAGNAALFGKYMGQVAARIERAWMKPRAPIESGHFDCRARVAQDRAGNVLSIALESCNEDATWRRSLETAILRASPLSAPPEPKLFSPTLTLNFTAVQYAAGETPEYEYEPAALRVAQAAADGASQVVRPPNGDVQLTITGSQVEWKKK